MLTNEKSNDLKVFISNRDSTCDECGEELGRKAWITLEEGKGAPRCFKWVKLDLLTAKMIVGYAL